MKQKGKKKATRLCDNPDFRIPCKHCGAPFHPITPSKVFCTTLCRELYWSEKDPVKPDDSRILAFVLLCFPVGYSLLGQSILNSILNAG